MTYSNSWWKPNEEEIGKTWRSIYNRFLKNPICWQTILEISDPRNILKQPISRMNLYSIDSIVYNHESGNKESPYLLSMELAYLLHREFGKQICESINTERALFTDQLKSLFLDNCFGASCGIDWSELNYASIDWEQIRKSIYIGKHDRICYLLEKLRKYIISSSTSLKVIDRQIMESCFEYYQQYCDLNVIKDVVIKTWGDPHKMIPWNEDDFDVLEEYFELGRYSLKCNLVEDTIDPESIEIVASGLSPSTEIDKTHRLLQIIMADFVTDFINCKSQGLPVQFGPLRLVG